MEKWNPEYLTNNDHSEANSLFVKDNDVYVVGTEKIDNKRVAMLWKNGIATQLTDGTHDAEANSIFIR